MLTRLANLLGIKSNERTLVLLLVIHSFFVGMPRTLGISVATGSLSGDLVPIALMFSAILAMLVTVVMDRLQARMKFMRLAHLNLIVQAISLGIFYAIFFVVGSDNPNLNLAFFVWIQVILVLSYREYWGLARKLMDIRQSKRLFALISSGEVIFAILVGLLNQLTPPEVYHLLPFGIVGIVGSIVIVLVIGRRFGHLLAETKSSRSRRRSTGGGGSQKLSFTPYLLLILGLTIIYAIAFGLIRQIYIGALEVQHPIKSDRVAFVLMLTAITNTFNLLVRLFLADNIMGRFGVAGGLLLLPIGVLISSGAIVAVYLFNPSAGSDAMIFFWLVIVLRGNVFVLKSSLDRPASLILLQTFSERIGQRILNLVTGIVDPLATGFTGLVLFLLVHFVFVGSIPTDILIFSLIIATLIWIAVVLFTLREYAASVLRVLQRRQIGAFSDLFQDKRNLNRIKINLKSDNPMEVIYALDVLDKLEDPILNEALKELLKHHDDLVRSEVLHLIEKNRLKDLLPQISLLAQREPQEDVRAIAVRALSALAEDDAFEVLMKYLKSRYAHIRTNAIIGLLRSGDLTGIINAGNALMALVESEIIEDRVQAANILGEVGNRDFYRLLVDLLQDKSAHVRNAALISAGKLKNPKLWPFVIHCLTEHETRSTAVRALHEADESVLDQFEPFFEDPRTLPAVLITLTRICSRMGGEAVRVFLIVHSDVPNLNVRKYVLEALAELDYQAETSGARERIINHIYDELNFATWCMASTIALRVYEEKTEFVVKALLEEIVQTKERVFYWLSFIYDTQTILNAKSKMETASSNEWALILEALDQTMESTLRMRVLPFYERLRLDEQFERMNQHFPQDADAEGLDYLEYIIGEEGKWIDPWLRTSAIYAAPEIARDVDISDALYAAVRFEHPMVAETALWSLSKLAPSLYKLYIAERATQDKDPSDLKSKTVGVMEDTIGLIRKVMSGGEAVLLTIEKVLILKKVRIFSDTSEEFLADISGLLDEVRVNAGQTVIEKGEEHTYLYIITEGLVEVRDGEHVLAELGQHELFGELGLFLEAPTHTASVVAKTDTHILTLHRDDFTEILYDYAQVAHGIIRELAQRLHQSNLRNIELNS